jgi:hypothetical protein
LKHLTDNMKPKTYIVQSDDSLGFWAIMIHELNAYKQERKSIEGKHSVRATTVRVEEGNHHDYDNMSIST